MEDENEEGLPDFGGLGILTVLQEGGGERGRCQIGLKIFLLYFPLIYQAFKWLRQTQMLESGDKTGDCGCSQTGWGRKPGAVGRPPPVFPPQASPPPLPSGSCLRLGLGLPPAAPLRGDKSLYPQTGERGGQRLPVLLLTNPHQKMHLQGAGPPQKCSFLPWF